jgi:hypothetical protein
MTLAAVRLGLWLLSFRTLQSLLQKWAKPGVHAAGAPAPQRVAWAVMAASGYVPRTSTCLPQALAVQALLSRAGYPAELHIGVAKNGAARLDAHAWVESQGEVVFGGWELERYERLLAPKGGGA